MREVKVPIFDKVNEIAMKRKTACQLELEERVKAIATYMIENKCTIQECADKFYISRSSAHIDLSYRLIGVSPSLHEQVSKVLHYNRMQGAIKGGKITGAKTTQARIAREKAKQNKESK